MEEVSYKLNLKINQKQDLYMNFVGKCLEQ